jgi:ABC-2 type transport system permease protein
MTAESLAPAPAVPATTRESVRLRPGWITIAAKELADHLLSIRLYVLLVVLGIAALIPLYFVGEDVRSVASSASGYPAIFLYLFAYQPQGVNFGPLAFTVQAFIAIAAPLLGVAFGFDAVNGERHQGTPASGCCAWGSCPSQTRSSG